MKDKLSYFDKQDYEKRIEYCNNCQGIDDCEQFPGKGRKPIIIEYQGRYILSNTKCEKARGSLNDNLILDQKYRTIDIDNKKEIISVIKEKHNLYLWGSVGKGKTHFLYWLANIYNEKGQDVHIELMSNVVRNVKQFKDDDYIEHLQTVQNLFLDDFGNEYATYFSIVDIVFPILDERYKRGLKTFITSNYDLNELTSMYANTVSGQTNLTEKQALTKVLTIKSRIGGEYGIIELQGKNQRL